MLVSFGNSLKAKKNQFPTSTPRVNCRKSSKSLKRRRELSKLREKPRSLPRKKLP